MVSSNDEAINHATDLYVSDQRHRFQEAKRFYCDILGFGLTEEFSEVLVLEHEGPQLVIHKAQKPAVIDYPNECQTLLVIEVRDINAAVRDFKAKGVAFVQDNPISATPGRYIGFRDPFGNVHELLQPAANQKK